MRARSFTEARRRDTYLRLPDGRRIYFAGDTNVFSDMALIRELYQPQLAMLPIGDLFTMSPREAAAACKLSAAGEGDPHALRHIPGPNGPS